MASVTADDHGALADADAVVALVLRGDAAEDLRGLLDRLGGSRLITEKRRMIPLSRSLILRTPSGVVVAMIRISLRDRSGLSSSPTPEPCDALTEEGVEVLDDEDILGVGGAPELVDERLEALLDLATELGARRRARRCRARAGARLREVSRHVALCDAVGEAADERRLAHAGLAHDERVVLEAPLQDLEQSARLDVAADHRIEAAVSRVFTRSRA